jgi:hypothetical protein
MEWYAVQMCQVPAEAASFFGALQLIALAAIWLFKIPLPCPAKEEKRVSGLAGGDLKNRLMKQNRA